MRKKLNHIALLIVLLVSFTASRAQQLVLYSVEAGNYPLVSAKCYKIDTSGRPDFSWDKSGAVLSEDGIERQLVSFDCPAWHTLNNLSSVLAIDISESMSGEGLRLAKSAALEWIRLLNTDESECAITSFNNYSYINRDFSRDKEKLTATVNALRSSGGTNYNAAFTDTLSGALSVAAHGRNTPVIVFLTDGIAEADTKVILDLAQKIGAKIYIVVLDMPASKNLTEIAKNSGGSLFDNIGTESEIKKAYQTILMSARGAEPCTLSWISDGCAPSRTARLAINSEGLSDEAVYGIASSMLPAVNASDGVNSYIYPVVVPPLKMRKNVLIKAVNKDIYIDTVYCDNPLFVVTNAVKGVKIPKGDDFALNVEFRPIDTNFTIGNLVIKSSACLVPDIYLAGGSSENGANNLRLNFPNGNEIFAANSDTLVTWSGALPKDSVKIEFSQDGGANWKTIAEKASGLIYKWHTPDISSNNCLMKVKRLSRSGVYNKVVYYDQKAALRALKWNSTGEWIACGDTLGRVAILNSMTGAFSKLYQPVNSPIKDVAWSRNDRYLAVQVSDFNIVVIDIATGVETAELESPVGKITSMAWNPDGEYVVAGTNQGALHVWEKLNKQPNRSLNLHGSLISSLAWNPDGTRLATGSYDGTVKIWDADSYNPVITIYSGAESIYSLSWNPTGRSIAFSGDFEEIHIYDTEKAESILTINSGPERVQQVRWSPDHNYIASISGRNLVSLWHPASGELAFNFDGAKNKVNMIEWNNEGTRIAGADEDGKIMVWYHKDYPFEMKAVEEDVSDKAWSVAKSVLRIKDVEFSPTLINDSRDMIVANFIRNDGMIAVRVDSVYVAGDDKNSFEVSEKDFPLVLQSGEAKDLKCSFLPKRAGLHADSIYVATNAGTFRQNISGTGASPKLRVIPDFIDFGHVSVGSISGLINLKIINMTGKDIAVDSTRFLGPNLAEFQTSSPQSFVVPANGSYLFNTIFRGMEKGRASSAIGFYYLEDELPLVAHLYGECRAAEPEIASTIEMHTPLCSSGTADTAITLRNTGNDVLNVKSLEISSNDFAVVSPAGGFKLNAGDTVKIIIEYRPKSPGNHSARLIIRAGGTALPGDSLVCSLYGINSSSSFELSKHLCGFYDLEEKQVGYDTLYIRNKGNVPLSWDYPVDLGAFKITEIIPSTTPVADSSRVAVRFIGGKLDTAYSASHAFSDSCGNTAVLLFKAVIGKSSAILTSAGSMIFRRIVCDGDKADTTLAIKNTGTSPMTISLVSIDPTSDAGFSVLNYPIEVAEGAADSIHLRFSGMSAGMKSGTLLIKTNAKNAAGGYIRISLSARRDISNMRISPGTAEFRNVPDNTPDTTNVTITNTGTTVINLVNLPDSARFMAEGALPATIVPGGTATVKIIFKGGAPTEEVFGSLDFTDSCGTIYKLLLYSKVRGLPQAGLMCGRVSGKSGEIVRIPVVKYKTPQSELPYISAFEAVLSYNASLLEPAGATPKGDIVNGMRAIPLHFSNIESSEGQLGELEFRVTLGNAEETALQLIDARAVNDPNIYVETRDGRFGLDEICREGGPRLVDYTGHLELSRNVPNPASNETRIGFWLIEKGRTELSLFDINGRKIRVLFSGYAEPGYGEVVLSTKDLPIGSYIYRLETPTQPLTRKMDVVR